MTVVKIVTAFDLNRVKTTLYTKKYFPEREKRKCFEYLIFWSRDCFWNFNNNGNFLRGLRGQYQRKCNESGQKYL